MIDILLNVNGCYNKLGKISFFEGGRNHEKNHFEPNKGTEKRNQKSGIYDYRCWTRYSLEQIPWGIILLGDHMVSSFVSGTRKDLSVWEQYIDCMMNGLSIRKTAVACGIHRNTAFLWRHKILDALQNMADDVTLDGIIEADETFFAISYKGNHSKSKTFAMPRKAHKRGHSTHIRGLSQEKVCVPCAVNRNGLSISKITNTGRVSTRDLHHIYDGRIKTNSTLVTDKMNSYVRFTNANGIDLVQLKTGKAKKGIYNIQHINSYHSQLKRFMRGFNGVSTKYLNNYLVWNNLVNYAKESDMEKRNIFLTFVLATLKTAKCRDLSNRPAVPLVA